ncbi:MAG: hypothetical protein GSR73_03285 [Desulfurococcales archaeon]|nr:hypothetical protein [Desulfurococcales archaeon]
MKEISWGKAFIYALKFAVLSLVWLLVGGILMVAGIVMATGGNAPIPSLLDNHQFETHASSLATVTTGAILVIVGYLTAILGSIATYFKLVSRLIVETSKD